MSASGGIKEVHILQTIKQNKMQKTIGGDRLGSGKKMKVNLHGYARSTHDHSFLWRSTMSSGTLVPFLSKVALPGDTWDINLGCEIMTHPTTGPLFGTEKVQLDIFLAPIRLYHSMLHNNALGIGLKMSQVVLPTLSVYAEPVSTPPSDMDNSQVNSSCILSYLGIRGAGRNTSGTSQARKFNAVPLLAYWEIYKNYYANKQEEIGMVIHTNVGTMTGTISKVEITQYNISGTPTLVVLPVAPGQATIVVDENADGMKITMAAGAFTNVQTNLILSTDKGELPADQVFANFSTSGQVLTGAFLKEKWQTLIIKNYRIKGAGDNKSGKPGIVSFPLENIDTMRNELLRFQTPGAGYDIHLAGGANLPPYIYLNTMMGQGQRAVLSTQEGLGLKTYQSDLFQNWIQTEWIDGVDGINTITAVDVSEGFLRLDALNLSKKVYEMMNRIAISGGSYHDWLETVYDHDRYTQCESPMYMGGLIRELAFQEVVSNASAGDAELGTLAGKGVMTQKKKGGHITIKVDEPSYIIGIVSLTPRIDYSQGNSWDTLLQTMDDLHKPGLDEIGFQELITDQLAWWDTMWDNINSKWIYKSAGKQPAWLNYMTSVNQTRGNFAIANNEMFMTLNRRYQYDATLGIKDLTTYIDPSQFNFIFAETALDSQNFWCQISCNMTARRKMSAKLMPNL